MANLAATAIRLRIREVLDDGAGLVRTVSSGRVSGNYWTGAGTFEGTARAVEKPRFTIPAIPFRPNAPGSFELGSFQLYVIEPTIECEYKLPARESTDLVRDAVLATAEQDADVFRQALGWAGNLTQTSAAAATGIVSGYLTFIAYEPVVEDWTAGRLITRHRYTGLVNVSTAVS